MSDAIAAAHRELVGGDGGGGGEDGQAPSASSPPAPSSSSSSPPPRHPYDLSGTTACVALHVAGRGLLLANVGDSRAVLGTVSDSAGPDGGGLAAVRLTRDQTPDVERERQRLSRAGASVRQDRDARGAAFGPYRVYGRSAADSAAGVPGLAMSRSLGDVSAHAWAFRRSRSWARGPPTRGTCV